MIRPVESDYTSHVAYARALEYYCDRLEQTQLIAPPPSTPMWTIPQDPPKRQWVGLTKAEMDKIISPGPFTGLIKAVVSTVESRLREKNQ